MSTSRPGAGEAVVQRRDDERAVVNRPYGFPEFWKLASRTWHEGEKAREEECHQGGENGFPSGNGNGSRLGAPISHSEKIAGRAERSL